MHSIFQIYRFLGAHLLDDRERDRWSTLAGRRRADEHQRVRRVSLRLYMQNMQPIAKKATDHETDKVYLPLLLPPPLQLGIAATRARAKRTLPTRLQYFLQHSTRFLSTTSRSIARSCSILIHRLREERAREDKEDTTRREVCQFVARAERKKNKNMKVEVKFALDSFRWNHREEADARLKPTENSRRERVQRVQLKRTAPRRASERANKSIIRDEVKFPFPGTDE